MSIQALSSRSWNGTPISRRTTDGYVNATAMCKANGKRWSDFREATATNAYMEALSRKTGIPVYDLSVSKQGNGTWVHQDLATELARWISPDFSVFVNQWFREEYERRASQPQEAQPAPPALDAQKTLDVIERSYNLLERLGVADERDCLQFGDMVRNNVQRLGGGALPPADPDCEELTISDAWLELTGERLPRGKDVAVGKLVAARYRKEFEKEPPTRKQYVDGALRIVKSYHRGWLVGAVAWVRDQVALAAK